VGRYTEAVSHNRRSIEADQRFGEAWGDRALPFVTSLPMSHSFHAWHAYDFMLYATVQLGQYGRSLETAAAALQTARGFSGEGPCAADRNIIALWFVEGTFGKWAALLERLQERPDAQCILLTGMHHYMKGSALNGLGRMAEAKLEQDALRRISTGADTRESMLAIAAASLDGEIREADGDLDGAIGAFRTAVALEDALPYAEPPEWPSPMRRFLGAALLAA